MGVNGYKRSDHSSEAWYVSPPNPDPSRYIILDYLEICGYLIIKLKYDNCTNFEGEKILVYEDTRLLDLLNQREIDPHFSDNKTKKFPIARFSPTVDGWSIAKHFVNAMIKDFAPF